MARTCAPPLRPSPTKAETLRPIPKKPDCQGYEAIEDIFGGERDLLEAERKKQRLTRGLFDGDLDKLGLQRKGRNDT